MGYRPRERLLRVELPLAVPLMIAGVRLAAVTLIGLATVASILGSSFGGLVIILPISLQLFPEYGLDLIPTFIAMVLLAIPPILVNAYAGLREVDNDFDESGDQYCLIAEATPA